MFDFFEKKSVTIPCEYSQSGSATCKDGTLLIYGEMGYRPPEWITCPKCNGTGFVTVSNKELKEAIKSLDEEIQILKDERRKFVKLLRKI